MLVNLKAMRGNMMQHRDANINCQQTLSQRCI